MKGKVKAKNELHTVKYEHVFVTPMNTVVGNCNRVKSRVFRGYNTTTYKV